MQLNYKGIQDTAVWEKAGVKLPKHDWKAMCAETEQNPVWVHFGAGNIFRIFVAGLMQRLLDAGESKAASWPWRPSTARSWTASTCPTTA